MSSSLASVLATILFFGVIGYLIGNAIWPYHYKPEKRIDYAKKFTSIALFIGSLTSAVFFVQNEPSVAAIKSLITISTFIPVVFFFGYLHGKFVTHKNPSATSTNNEVEDLSVWEMALAEFEGDKRNKGLWARSYSEAMGDDNKAKAIYIKKRVDEILKNKIST